MWVEIDTPNRTFCGEFPPNRWQTVPSTSVAGTAESRYSLPMVDTPELPLRFEFDGRIGQPFAFSDESGRSVQWTLKSVEPAYRRPEGQPYGTPVPDDSGRCYSLVFAGSDTQEAEQGILTMEAEGMSPMALFVSPLGPGEDGVHRYELVVSR